MIKETAKQEGEQYLEWFKRNAGRATVTFLVGAIVGGPLIGAVLWGLGIIF